MDECEWWFCDHRDQFFLYTFISPPRIKYWCKHADALKSEFQAVLKEHSEDTVCCGRVCSVHWFYKRLHSRLIYVDLKHLRQVIQLYSNQITCSWSMSMCLYSQKKRKKVQKTVLTFKWTLLCQTGVCFVMIYGLAATFSWSCTCSLVSLRLCDKREPIETSFILQEVWSSSFCQRYL